MSSRLTSLYSRLGRIEKLFLLLLVLYIGWSISSPNAGVVVLLGFLLYVFAVVEAVRLIRWWIGKVIWRLRNRLIVAYAFIAIVPIVLVAALAGLSIFILTGGVATYLVSSELDRRSQALLNQAVFLTRRAANERAEILHRMLPLARDRYGELEVLVQGPQELRYPATSSLSPPPAGWGDTHGILRKDGRIFLWAHVDRNGSRVTLIAPVDHDYLSNLIPGLGEAVFLDTSNPPSGQAASGQRTFQLDLGSAKSPDRTPPPYNRMDIQISGAAPLRIADWDRPGETRDLLLVVRTRTSALMRVVYGQTSAYLGEGVLAALVMISVVFLVVEIVSLVIGVSLTRTITGAVHELYEGTQRIRAGDFSHRIAVAGHDQLSELGVSFNRMTEDLERLFVVEKEKERLQSELEIAREVQAQLFPKALPEMRTLQLAGVCHPARMVSGDYYDFLRLDHSLAVAIGDVAGKGISAALLMAAIQSTMRTQLTGGAALSAAAAAGGWAQPQFSTAHVVSQLNKQLYANTAPEKYATFCFALYDEASGILRYTNAGHLPPILLRNGQPELLEVTGTVVGAFPLASYEERTITMNPGDLLTAYTDGVVEPENEYGEQFGEERLNDLLVRYERADTGELIARVMENVRDWTGTSELQDDMTMVVIRRL